MRDKSGPEKLQGYWILELGELAGMRKTDVETVKVYPRHSRRHRLPGDRPRVAGVLRGEVIHQQGLHPSRAGPFDDWQKSLELDKQGAVKPTLDNLVLVMRSDERLRSIAFNLHRDGIDAGEGLPWKQIKPGWNDADFASLKVYLSNVYGVYSPRPAPVSSSPAVSPGRTCLAYP